MWKEGSILFKNVVYHYMAKVFDKPSKYGINKGRISKLDITVKGKSVCQYDRGWEIEPSSENVKVVLAIMLEDYK